MTSSTALTAALVADTNHLTCFDADGTEYRWSELMAAASRVYERLARSDGRRWVLNLDRAFDFSAAMLGCWAARKTPVLAPPTLLAGVPAIEFDGVIEPAGSRTIARERIVLERLPEPNQHIEEIAPSAPLVLYTSGSTGVPKEVRRELHNVEAELAAIETLWGNALGKARFFTTVSHRHVYGMLFGVLWPLLNRRPFANFFLEFPEQLADTWGNGQALISSPALLKRIGHLPSGSQAWRAVFSSGGLLPASAAADTERVLGVSPVEVLGSTETSGVAWRSRRGVHGTCFTAMPDVETRPGPSDLLETRSPFSGQPGWITMGDRVRFAADNSFELLGRGDHLAKIEDKRVSLAEIERYLLETPFVADAACVALEDGRRQYVGAILQLTAEGAAELVRGGRRCFNESLKAALRPRIEGVALPRKFRYVEAIPVDTQGKRQPAMIERLFDKQ
jgi:acyl-coenzyme A synthetase/AMP-(fatty) acid ligase